MELILVITGMFFASSILMILPEKHINQNLDIIGNSLFDSIEKSRARKKRMKEVRITKI